DYKVTGVQTCALPICSSLIEAATEDYVHVARLRGLSEARILVGHMLKNAALPTVTLIGVQFGFLFGGTLLVELIYSFPGLGNLKIGRASCRERGWMAG